MANNPFKYKDYEESDVVKKADTNKTNAENALASYGDYAKSDEVIAADNKKINAENAVNNYGDFSYSKDATFNDIVNKILNREKFSYDLNGDALYQQYKDKYIQQGKMAMQDTMGQAAAMTGGYGNSYAASVGNQAYQAQLNNLNDVIPELYQMAYDKYNQEGQDLYNQYGMLSDDRNMEYGMWGDKYNRLVADRDYYSNEANNAYVRDYGEWSDKRNQLVSDRDYYTNVHNNERNFYYGKYSDDKTYAYQDHRDAIADEQWQKTFDEGVRQFNEQQALTKEQWEWQKANASSGGSGGSGGSDDEDNEANEADLYADWNGGDWEHYFAHIRQTEGQAAAEAELNRMTQEGLIPKNMVAMAAAGARGSSGGH